MTTREQLLHEINSAPDLLLEEVLDFLLFAKNRRHQQAPEPPSTELASLHQPSPPIWEAFEAFADALPESVAATLPTDGATQLDHYLYGSPKRDE